MKNTPDNDPQWEGYPSDNPTDVAAFDEAHGDKITSTPAVDAVKPLAAKLYNDNEIEHPLYLNLNTQADSWVTEECPGAIRIARACPPFAFGEDVAAVHLTLPGFARDIVARYNACVGLSTDILELAVPGRIAEMLDERAALLVALKRLEMVATKMLAGGFNGKMADMHKALGNGTEQARAEIARAEGGQP